MSIEFLLKLESRKPKEVEAKKLEVALLGSSSSLGMRCACASKSGTESLLMWTVRGHTTWARLNNEKMGRMVKRVKSQLGEIF